MISQQSVSSASSPSLSVGQRQVDWQPWQPRKVEDAQQEKENKTQMMAHLQPQQPTGQTVRNLTRQVLKVIENIGLKEKDPTYSKVTSELESLVMKQTTQCRVARSKASPYPANISSHAASTITSTPITFDGSALLGLKDRFKTELCRKFMENTTCPYGKKCQFAHGYHELRPVNRHPRYRTELCREFFTHGLCTYGARCNFIHVSSDQQHNEQKCEVLSKPGPLMYNYIMQQQQQQQQTSDLYDRPYTPEQDSGLCLSSISPISASFSPAGEAAQGNFDASDHRFFAAAADAALKAADAASAGVNDAVAVADARFGDFFFTSDRNNLYSRV